MSESFLDGISAPEVYTSHLGGLEDAGDGMVRVIRCIKRNGVLVPVVNLIIPAMNILRDGPRYTEIAHRMLQGEMALH